MFMYPFVIVIHVITCILLVVVVLLQQGKGAEIGAVFGASDTIFGSSGPASFLHKFTAGLAALFMITSFTLTYMSAHRVENSVMQNVEEAPVIPKAPLTTKAPIKSVKKGVNIVPKSKTATTTKKPAKVSAKKPGVLKAGQAVQGPVNKQTDTSGEKKEGKKPAEKPSPADSKVKTAK